MFIPNAPMQLVSIDIAYIPKDAQGFQYMLLIGDVFSKFVTVPLKTQTAPDVVNALLNNWIYIHGTPSYLLSDQGSNVDGQTKRDICNELGIEKRRSLAYHSQGNGFPKRNICSVRDMLRTLLLDQKLGQEKWRKVLQSLVFVHNSSFSNAIKCVPFNVVFGRTAVLPQDIIFQSFFFQKFREDEQTRKLWVKFIQHILKDFTKPEPFSCIFSLHISPV